MDSSAGELEGEVRKAGMEGEQDEEGRAEAGAVGGRQRHDSGGRRLRPARDTWESGRWGFWTDWATRLHGEGHVAVAGV